MKRIFLKVILIGISVFILDRSVGFVLNRCYAKTISGEFGGDINYLLNNQKDVNVLIFGNSRAKYQIDPAKLHSLPGVKYNGSFSGVGTIFFNNILLEVVLKSKLHPSSLILQADVTGMIEEPAANYQLGINIMYPYLARSKTLRQFTQQLRFEERLKLKSKLYQFNGKVPSLIYNYFKRNSIGSSNGFVPLFETLDTTKKTEPVFSFNGIFKFDEKKLQALDNIISMCNSNGIRLYIIFSPYYRDVLFRPAELSALKDHINKQSPLVKIIDMASISKYPALQNVENWKDHAHLNYLGAERFSGYLDDSLKAYLNR